ncbi:MAG: CocE/NonD family hydrolase [Kiritimatiellaeota bacterium]|nr:CocE/NonD family hydrolase [Kiritimatiellota bacterium]
MQYRLCRRVPAADGTELATDVYLPDGPGPFPAVLVRTPYHRTSLQGTAGLFVARGYACVVQDCRGKYDSDGLFRPLVDEAADGQAALDWVANRRWCNGRIGLWGRSYLGIVQVPAAAGGHEALRCIVPSVAPGSFFRDWIRYDGCFALANAVRWSVTHASCRTQPPMQHFSWEDLHGLGGVEEIATRVGFGTPVLKEWAVRDRYNGYWKNVDQYAMHERVRVPGLHTGGWFDHLTRGQYAAYSRIRDVGATDRARSGQRLLIGPWGHTTTGARGGAQRRYGEWDFGPAADFPLLEHELRFLDLHLKDRDDGLLQEAPVKVFLMGENRWVDLEDWPPPAAEVRNWHLDSMGETGTLRQEVPDRDIRDSYACDPREPVPTRGGPIYWGLPHAGPVDVRPILARPDVLYYRSEILPQALTILGDVGLDLFVASDAEDTDFVARLCVEEASGAVICLTLGSLRCRYRESWSAPLPLEKNRATAIHLQMGQLGYVFPAGARIGLMVASSDYPRILPHDNTMAGPWAGGESVVAHNSVLHGPGVRSCLRLPVVDLE